MTTTERIQYLIDITQKPVSTIAKESGLKNSVISDLLAGRAKAPSADTLIKLSRYFNVSADYLLCLTDEPRPLENTEKGQMSLSPIEKGQMSLLMQEQRFTDTAKLYKALPDQYRERVFGLVMGIAVGLGINVEKVLGR